MEAKAFHETTPNAKVKILIVDDVAANLYSLEQILQTSDYQIFKASSGKEAIKLATEHDFACCLLDIRMPLIDGFQTAELMREDPKKKNLPIIFVTAEANDQKIVFKGYGLGAVDFLIKPLEPQIVLSKVKVFGELYLQRLALDHSYEIYNLNKKLAKANEDLEHFTHICSHDLREPLRRQMNFIDLLVHDYQHHSEHEIAELLGRVKKDSHDMYRMIEDFRELTKISWAYKHREHFDIKKIIETCVHDLHDRIAEQEVQVEFEDFPESVEAYPTLIKLVYNNLILNALEHTKSQNFSLRFTYQKNSQGQFFGVYNSHSSIPESELGNIFKMFRHGNMYKECRGRGIGLSICKRIIDRHSGNIWAESGNGYTHIKFTIGEPNEFK